MAVFFVQPVRLSVTTLNEGGQCVELTSDFLIMSVYRQSEVNYVNVRYNPRHVVCEKKVLLRYIYILNFREGIGP